MIAAIKSSPLFNPIELGSITLYEGDEDVRDMEYDLNKYPPSSSHPMVFCIVDKRGKFLTVNTSVVTSLLSPKCMGV